MQRVSNILKRVESSRPFTEAEAWWLYRAAALGEAIGWSVLIVGVGFDHYRLVGHKFILPIGGQVHGILFIMYFGIFLATYTSQHWPRRYFAIAAIAGVLPYATLVFEQFVARRRKDDHARSHFRSVLLSAITQALAVQ